MQETTPFKVLQTKLELQDYIINMDELTEIEDFSPFKVEEMSKMPYEKDDFTRQDVTIEMNLDLRVISRDGYTLLDWVSDVGGA